MGQGDPRTPRKESKGRSVTLKGLTRFDTKRGAQSYWYVRRKGLPLVRMPDLPHDDPRFLAAYAAAWAVEAPVKATLDPESGFAAHVRRIIASRRYRDKSPEYRAGLRRNFDEMREDFGNADLAELTSRDVADDVEDADNPLLRLKAWRFLCHGMLPDPSKAVTVPQQKTDGHPPWTADEITAYRMRWHIGTVPRAAMELLFWTGARISDGVRIGRGNVGPDGVLAFRQKKTGGMAYVAWSCELPDYAASLAADRAQMHEALAALPGSHMTFLATVHGRGRSDKALGTLISDAAEKAGFAKTAHGLRKARAVALADNGATTHQIAAWTGHASLKEIEHYTKEADRRKAVRGNSPGTETVQNTRRVPV
jgi:integrase/recombinase XerD